MTHVYNLINKALHLMLFLWLYGCNIKPGTQQSINTSTYATTYDTTRMFSNSNTSVEVNTEQNKVIGNLRFGMSRTISEKIIESFKQNGKDGYGYYLGNCKVENIKGYYFEDSLYEIEIYGREKKSKLTKTDAEMYNILEKADVGYSEKAAKQTYREGELVFSGELHSNLLTLLESKYGKPINADALELSLGKIVEYKHQNPFSHSVAVWIAGEKRVVLETPKKTGNVTLTISQPNVALRKSLKLDVDRKHTIDSIANTVFN